MINAQRITQRLEKKLFMDLATGKMIFYNGPSELLSSWEISYFYIFYFKHHAIFFKRTYILLLKLKNGFVI